MSPDLPDYTTVRVPDGKTPSDYTTHERRADLLRQCISAGSPYAVNQSNQAERYDVDRSTVSRDMTRLQESISDALGEDAKLTAQTVFERTLLDLRQADDWRASKVAFDCMMKWNEWLADLGLQEREPDRAEVDIRSRSLDVSYQIVREGEELPTDEDETVDHDALGFTSGPIGVGEGEGGAVDVQAVDETADTDAGGETE